MDNLTGLKAAFSLISTFLVTFFGGYDNLLNALVIFLIVDYLTGILASVCLKQTNSATGLQGIIKKIMQLFLVGICATLDSIIGYADPYLRTMAIFFILSNEGISILENIAKAGVPVPPFLKKALEQLNKEDKTQ
jgi:toxin secretion/phage lysis holin